MDKKTILLGDRKDPHNLDYVIKLRFNEEVPMSAQGVKQWNKRMRGKIRKKVYKHVMVLHIPVREINSKKKIASVAEQYLYAGKFYMFGYSHGKTRTHVKAVCLAVIYVTRVDDRNKAVVRLYVKGRGRPRMSRYWFFQKEKKKLEKSGQ